jgi:hypothetical protein
MDLGFEKGTHCGWWWNDATRIVVCITLARSYWLDHRHLRYLFDRIIFGVNECIFQCSSEYCFIPSLSQLQTSESGCDFWGDA